MSPDHNLSNQEFKIKRSDREQLLSQKGQAIWFTGLSGSGKSTLCDYLATSLTEEGKLVYILDGDKIRKGLNQDLGFSQEHRSENLRRIAEVAKLFVDAGCIVLVSFITPLEEQRELVKGIIQEKDFTLCYVKCDLKVCETRDVKGLYALARKGEIKEFTGVSSPFEEPKTSNIVVNTDECSAKEASEKILSYLSQHSKI